MMSGFLESDYYVLVAAVARNLREARPFMMVRTETLFEIGAGDLVTSGDKAAYEQFEASVRHTHTSMVEVAALNQVLTSVPQPSAAGGDDEE
jgi:hypothetical protein